MVDGKSGARTAGGLLWLAITTTTAPAWSDFYYYDDYIEFYLEEPPLRRHGTQLPPPSPGIPQVPFPTEYENNHLNAAALLGIQ